MDTGTLIALVVVGVIVIVAIAWMLTKGKARKTEKLRHEARGTRDIAGAAHLEAEHQAAQAEERAARAKREQLEAEREMAEADRARAEAQRLAQRADEVDPDQRGTRR